jgi:hypothetical protein
MAIKIGKPSEENAFKLFEGIGAFKVIAINPCMKELQEMGRNADAEPVYIGKNDNGESTARIQVYIRTNPDAPVNNGIEFTTSFIFNLTRAKRVGTNSGKIQVIDKFGRTAWATQADIDNKTIPVYANGPANISESYRPAAVGEENLINFLIAWLNIPSVMEYNRTTSTWSMKKDTEECEVSLDLAKIFEGNFDELKEIVKLATEFEVKGAFGVRTTDKGQYQAVYTRMFLRNASSKYDKLEQNILDAKNSGAEQTTEYSTIPLHEYNVKPTEFKSQEKEDELPW